MTDGIIQEVFKKYSNDLIYDFLISIQRELIEKIKQAMPHLIDSENNSHTQAEILKVLIGDNQE